MKVDARTLKNLGAIIALALPYGTEDAERFAHDLVEESDRGCALLGGAWLEDGLGQLLRAFVVDDKDVAERLFGADGAFGTFSRRIDMAFALGLLTGRQRRNFDIIRTIRNRAAHLRHAKKGHHQWDADGFNAPPIASLCNKLEIHNAFQLSEEPRIRFTVVTAVLLANMMAGAHFVKHVPVREHDGFAQAVTMK